MQTKYNFSCNEIFITILFNVYNYFYQLEKRNFINGNIYEILYQILYYFLSR